MSKKPPKPPKNPIKDRLDKAEKVELRVIDGGNERPARPKKSGKSKSKSESTPSSPDFDLYRVSGPAPPPTDDYNPPDGLSPAEIELVRKCANKDQNDRDNGWRLVTWFGDDLIYVVGLGWLTWRGTHWQCDEGELQSRLKAQNLVDKIKLEVPFIEPSEPQQRLLAAAEAVAKKPVEEQTADDTKLLIKAAKGRDQLMKKKTARRTFAVSSGNATKTTAMLVQAASLLTADQDMLDADRMAINVQNGTLKIVRIEDMECPDEDITRYKADICFKPHARADMITKCADVTYDPKTKCPDFMKFLERAQPDENVRLFLQVFHGMAMLGGKKEQKVIFHYGTGANGKTVFIETLGRLCGQYRTVVSPDTITGDSARGGQQASPDLARLFNTRVATIEELPRGSPLKENLLKAVSGGGKILARSLHKDPFEFYPLFTAVMSGNDMPAISGTDDGIWRRLLLVHWLEVIPEREQIELNTMLALLDKERSGILNWLLEGISLYLERGLKEFVPPSVSKFANEYRADKDPVGQFVEACVTRTPGPMVQAKDMFKAYQDWSEYNGMKPWQQKAFGTRMSALRFDKKRGRIYEYLDCELHDVPVTEPPPSRTFGY